jgi:hypothetical protein
VTQSAPPLDDQREGDQRDDGVRQHYRFEHYRFECPVRFADARGRVKIGEDSVVACDADLLPWCL